MSKKIKENDSNSWATAKEEYYFLQSEIGRYDDISHKIKNWSITVGFALIAAAFYRSTPLLFLVSSVGAALFWMTEARWKRYQRIHIARIKKIEAFLIGNSDQYIGPSINRSFAKRLGTRREALQEEWRAARLSNVSLPHNLIFSFGLLLFLLWYIGVVEFSNGTVTP